MSASPDHAVSHTNTPDPVSPPAIVSEMADVAGAMFSLLLLRTLGSPLDGRSPLPAVAEPTGPPAVLPAPLDPTPALALPVPVPVLDIAPAPALAVASIAMPESLPVLHHVPEPVVPEASENAFPVTASTPAINTAMLSEIGFLDD